MKSSERFCSQWPYRVTDVSHMHEKVHVTAAAKSPHGLWFPKDRGSEVGWPEKGHDSRWWARVGRLSLIAWLSSLRHTRVTGGCSNEENKYAASHILWVLKRCLRLVNIH